MSFGKRKKKKRGVKNLFTIARQRDTDRERELWQYKVKKIKREGLKKFFRDRNGMEAKIEGSFSYIA